MAWHSGVRAETPMSDAEPPSNFRAIGLTCRISTFALGSQKLHPNGFFCWILTFPEPK